MEVGDDLLEWTCGQCEKIKHSDIGEYTGKIFRLLHLRKAGYPLKASDLTPEEWEDLGKAEELMGQKTRDSERMRLAKTIASMLER